MMQSEISQYWLCIILPFSFDDSVEEHRRRIRGAQVKVASKWCLFSGISGHPVSTSSRLITVVASPCRRAARPPRGGRANPTGLTVKRFQYDSHDQLRTHLADFMAAYNFARRLKTLNGLTPYEYICKIWTSEPDRFILNPIHQMPGLNT